MKPTMYKRIIHHDQVRFIKVCKSGSIFLKSTYKNLKKKSVNIGYHIYLTLYDP